MNKHTQNQLLSDMYKDLVVLLKPNIFQDCQELIKTRRRKQYEVKEVSTARGKSLEE